jgi:hypothetical protein
MRDTTRRRRARVLAFLLLAGCGGQSVDSALEKHGPAARATVASFGAIAEDLRVRPPVASNAVTPPLGAEQVRLAATDGNVNADVVYLEDLQRPAELGNVYARLSGSADVTDCAALVTHKTHAWDPRKPEYWTYETFGHAVAPALETCGKLRVLFVLRTMELVKPRDARYVRTSDAGVSERVRAVARSDCKPNDVRCLFDGGYVRAEVHVFALGPVVHKGAFVIEAESSEVAVVRGLVEDDLERDLAEKLATAFRAGVLLHFPTAVVGGW